VLVYGDNDASSTCAVYWYFGGSGYTFNPYWAYYMYETPTYGGTYGAGCSYSRGGISHICQTIRFSTIGYTAESYYSGSGWNGFAHAAPSGDTQEYVPHYIYQGVQDTSVAVNSGSTTQFTQTWKSSQQL
jgi:hypothetical protein